MTGQLVAVLPVGEQLGLGYAEALQQPELLVEVPQLAAALGDRPV